MDIHIQPGHAFGWPETLVVTGFALLFIIIMVIVKELYSIAGAPANVVIRTGKTAV